MTMSLFNAVNFVNQRNELSAKSVLIITITESILIIEVCSLLHVNKVLDI